MEANETKKTRNQRKREVGVVISDKMDKTITVQVEWLTKHRQYGKYVRRRTKLYAHDAANEAHVGDKVEVMMTRPLSKKKRWRLVSVVRKAAGTQGAHAEPSEILGEIGGGKDASS